MDNPVAIISCDRFHGFVLGRFIAAEFPGCTVKVYHSALRALAALEVESFSYSFMGSSGNGVGELRQIYT